MLTIIPTIKEQLQSNDAHTRQTSTACLGKLFATDKTLIVKNQIHFDHLFKRQTDANSGVRIEFVRVLGRLLLKCRADRVIFSAHGLREGMLSEHLTPEQRRADPLLASSRLTALASSRNADVGLGHGHGDGARLTDWLTPLFPDEDEDHRRLRIAAGLLSDIGWRIHPDERPDHAMADVLRAPLTGLDHRQRIMLGLAIRFRYTHKRDSRWVERYGHLIEDDDRLWSRQVGQALRLAHTLSGGVMELLAQYSLSLDDSDITLHGTPENLNIIGEATRKRLTAMARSFDRSAVVAAD